MEERKSGGGGGGGGGVGGVGGGDLACPLRYHGGTFLPVRDVEHAFLPCVHHSVLNQSQKRIEKLHYPLMNNKSKRPCDFGTYCHYY